MSGISSGGASRDGYGKGLLRLAEDPRVVVLEADLGKSTKSHHFREKFPERTVSLGIAEQNMMIVAAGMASSGKVPFASTFAIFTERAFEQIRNGIARAGLNVHICGSHGGIHTGSDGSSAQSIEDLGIYRTIPNMTVIHPCDDLSAEELTVLTKDLDTPSYMRTVRNKVPRVYTTEEASNLEIGKGSVIRKGSDVAIIACGIMVGIANEASKILESEGISAFVVDMHTLKPLDNELLSELGKICGCFVTAEDHSVIGGLGSAVSEWSSEECPLPIEKIGVKDIFGESGESHELLEKMGMLEGNIVEAAKKVLRRKKI